MMMFNNKLDTMDFQVSSNESVASKTLRTQSQRIGADNTTDTERRRSGSPVDDTNNMFTKFAFPFKLHSILESAGTTGKESIISWLPSGKAFKIHKPKEFADVIMPQYFNQTKYRSFQRQLYIYGFDRVKDKSSDDYGAYFHELFIRGSSDLCLYMQRKKIKGTGLSNEERRKKASILRAGSRPSSKKRSMKVQNDITLEPFPPTNTSHSINSTDAVFSALRMNNISNQLNMPMPTKLSITEDWNSPSAAAVIKSAIQVQEFATRQETMALAQNSNNIAQQRFPQFEKMSKIGRRCSLGFVRGMGRRGSLLFDGDEVLFGDKKFYFTTEY